MVIVQVLGIVVAAVVILVLAYLYRESAILEGKTEVSVGPWKFSLGGRVQPQADVRKMPASSSPAAASEIEQAAADSAVEIQSDAGEIEQAASGSGPEIS